MSSEVGLEDIKSFLSSSSKGLRSCEVLFQKRSPKGDHTAGHSLRPRVTAGHLMSSRLTPVPFWVPLAQRGTVCTLSSLAQDVFRAAPGTGTLLYCHISLPKQALSYSACEGQMGQLPGRQQG